MDEEFTDYSNEDGPLENCPECGKLLCDIEFDMQHCDSCGWPIDKMDVENSINYFLKIE